LKPGINEVEPNETFSHRRRGGFSARSRHAFRLHFPLFAFASDFKSGWMLAMNFKASSTDLFPFTIFETRLKTKFPAPPSSDAPGGIGVGAKAVQRRRGDKD